MTNSILVRLALARRRSSWICPRCVCPCSPLVASSLTSPSPRQAIHEDLDDHSDDKDDEHSAVVAENAVSIETVPAQQKLFKTLQYLHYKFFDMIQQFTQKYSETLKKGDKKSLEIWRRQVINAAYRKVCSSTCVYRKVCCGADGTRGLRALPCCKSGIHGNVRLRVDNGLA